ncbi:hypothetical protein LOD99_6088 [Oopsacas minuta]|uniref:Uncharacterized protein n=1 Tax=Oopsacas minuta TaxID=111878 RepID=A0AAV7JP53_9METZ|nr:hypothetical protein LOD99_6088 [Oopsacas minuta]
MLDRTYADRLMEEGRVRKLDQDLNTVNLYMDELQREIQELEEKIDGMEEDHTYILSESDEDEESQMDTTCECGNNLEEILLLVRKDLVNYLKTKSFDENSIDI